MISMITQIGYSRQEARRIMEQFRGRKLLSAEIVHHKDENPLNNNIDNLELVTRGEHAIIHSKSEERRQNMSKAQKGRKILWSNKISEAYSKKREDKKKEILAIIKDNPTISLKELTHTLGYKVPRQIHKLGGLGKLKKEVGISDKRIRTRRVTKEDIISLLKENPKIQVKEIMEVFGFKSKWIGFGGIKNLKKEAGILS